MESIGFASHGVTSALEAQATAINQIMSGPLVNQGTLKNSEQVRSNAMSEQGKGQNINVVG